MRKPRVLIVEDEFLIADTVALMLEDLGYGAADVMATEEEALAYIQTNHADCAILDILLQGKWSFAVA